MSAALYPVLERDVPGFDVTHMDGVALLRALPDGDQENALTPLTRFLSIGADEWENLMDDAPEFADLAAPTT